MLHRSLILAALAALCLALLPNAAAQSSRMLEPLRVTQQDEVTFNSVRSDETPLSVGYRRVTVEGVSLSVASRRSLAGNTLLFDASSIASALQSRFETQNDVLTYYRMQDHAVLTLSFDDGEVRSDGFVLGSLPDFEPRGTATTWLTPNAIAVLTGTTVTGSAAKGYKFMLDDRLRPPLGVGSKAIGTAKSAPHSGIQGAPDGGRIVQASFAAGRAGAVDVSNWDASASRRVFQETAITRQNGLADSAFDAGETFPAGLAVSSYEGVFDVSVRADASKSASGDWRSLDSWAIPEYHPSEETTSEIIDYRKDGGALQLVAFEPGMEIRHSGPDVATEVVRISYDTRSTGRMIDAAGLEAINHTSMSEARQSNSNVEISASVVSSVQTTQSRAARLRGDRVASMSHAQGAVGTRYFAKLRSNFGANTMEDQFVDHPVDLDSENDVSAALRRTVMLSGAVRHAKAFSSRAGLAGRSDADGYGARLPVSDWEGKFAAPTIEPEFIALSARRSISASGYRAPLQPAVQAAVASNNSTHSDTVEYSTGHLRGALFIDMDGNGKPNAGDERLEGELVQLVDVDTSAIIEAPTAAFGQYGFQDVGPGRYKLRVQIGWQEYFVDVARMKDDLMQVVPIAVPPELVGIEVENQAARSSGFAAAP